MSYIPTKQAFSFVEEFRNFLFKGNMIDMAVGIIIGGAFGALVNSLVKNVIMPLVAAATTLNAPEKAAEPDKPAATAPAAPAASPAAPPAKKDPAQAGDMFKDERFAPKVNGVPVPWGVFVADFINFVILGLVIFIVIVKFVGWITKSKKEEAAAPPPPPADVALLTEIRDLLKAQAAKS